jgi:hypothetical protein
VSVSLCLSRCWTGLKNGVSLRWKASFLGLDVGFA